MTAASADTVFQVEGITPLLKHLFIIIRFQEGSVTLFEIMDQLIARFADIRENADIGFGCADYKTVRIAGIMLFLKGSDLKSADLYRLLCSKMRGKLPDFPETRFFQCGLADIYRHLVFTHQLVDANDMIAVFMGNENCPDAT